MKLLVNNYHLLCGPKPITLMSTVNLHRNPNEVGGIQFPTWQTGKLRNRANLLAAALSVSTFKARPVPAGPVRIPLSSKHRGRDLLPQISPVGTTHWLPSPTGNRVPKAGVGNSTHLAGRRGPLRRSRSGLRKAHAHLTLPSSQALSPEAPAGPCSRTWLSQQWTAGKELTRSGCSHDMKDHLKGYRDHIKDQEQVKWGQVVKHLNSVMDT